MINSDISSSEKLDSLDPYIPNTRNHDIYSQVVYNVTFLELLKCDFIVTVFLKHCSEVLVDVISVIIVT